MFLELGCAISKDRGGDFWPKVWTATHVVDEA